MTKKQIIEKILANDMLIRQYGISKIGLFGSYSRQQQRKDSDIDILIAFEDGKETFDNFMAIYDLMEQTFIGYKVEILTIGGLSPYIGPHILKNVEYVQIAN
jgi:uncharacterized protein